MSSQRFATTGVFPVGCRLRWFETEINLIVVSFLASPLWWLWWPRKRRIPKIQSLHPYWICSRLDLQNDREYPKHRMNRRGSTGRMRGLGQTVHPMQQAAMWSQQPVPVHLPLVQYWIMIQMKKPVWSCLEHWSLPLHGTLWRIWTFLMNISGMISTHLSVPAIGVVFFFQTVELCFKHKTAHQLRYASMRLSIRHVNWEHGRKNMRRCVDFSSIGRCLIKRKQHMKCCEHKSSEDWEIWQDAFRATLPGLGCSHIELSCAITIIVRLMVFHRECTLATCSLYIWVPSVLVHSQHVASRS